MYENITYNNLKGLPDEQKKEALLELQSRFGDNKGIANALGISMIAISNMVKKYVLGEHVGRKKKEDIEEQAEPNREVIQSESIDVAEDKPKTKHTPKVKDNTLIEQPANNIENQSIFNISVSKTLQGESIQYLLNGIGNTLIKDQLYKLTVTIME